MMVLNKVWATLKAFDCYKTAWAWVESVKPHFVFQLVIGWHQPIRDAFSPYHSIDFSHALRVWLLLVWRSSYSCSLQSRFIRNCLCMGEDNTPTLSKYFDLREHDSISYPSCWEQLFVFPCNLWIFTELISQIAGWLPDVIFTKGSTDFEIIISTATSIPVGNQKLTSKAY